MSSTQTWCSHGYVRVVVVVGVDEWFVVYICLCLSHRSMPWTSSGPCSGTLVSGKTSFPSSPTECRQPFWALPLQFGQWVLICMLSTSVCLCGLKFRLFDLSIRPCATSVPLKNSCHSGQLGIKTENTGALFRHLIFEVIRRHSSFNLA